MVPVLKTAKRRIAAWPHALGDNQPHGIDDGRGDRLDSLVPDGCPRPERPPISLRSRFQPVGANPLAARAILLQDHMVDSRGGRQGERQGFTGAVRFRHAPAKAPPDFIAKLPGARAVRRRTEDRGGPEGC